MLGGKRGQKSSMWDFFDKLEIQFAHKGELDSVCQKTMQTPLFLL